MKRISSLILAVILLVSTISCVPFISHADTIDNQVYGYVTTDPIIYTHGTSKYTHSDFTDTASLDYMMYGTTIADGSYAGECKTAISVDSSKTIASIDVVESTNDSVSISSGCLTGNIGSEFQNVTSDNNSVATLKFNFTDSTYEYHRFPVFTNPVAEHTLVSTFNWASGVGTLSLETHRRVVSCEVLAKGSYGQTASEGVTIGSKVENSNAVSTDFNNNNFATMYNPHNGVFDSWESNKKICIDSMTDEMASGDSAFDKVTGFSFTSLYNKKSREITKVYSPIATYYVDLSSNKNYGVELNDNKYSINMFIGSLFFSSKANYMLNGEPRTESDYSYETVSVASGNSTAEITTASNKVLYTNKERDKSEVNPNESQTITSATISGNAVPGTSQIKYELELGSGVSGGGVSTSANITTNIKLVVSDKSEARTLYNTYISALKAQTMKKACYTAESFENFNDALYETEKYLNDNTDTSSAALVKNTLETAYNNLEESTDDSAHSFGAYSSNNNASCTNDGTKSRTCSLCGYKQTVTDVGTKFGHTEITIPAVAATCTSVGYTSGTKCSVCKTVLIQPTEIAMLPHKIVNDPAVAVTCTQAGKTAGTHCSECKTVLTAQTTIPATGHSWNSGVVTTEATCVKNGVITYTCSNCLETKTKVIDCLGHNMDAGVTVEPTCTEMGYKKYTCSRCDFVNKENYVNPKGHSYIYVGYVAPTETTDGSTGAMKCTSCGDAIDSGYAIPATNHNLTFVKTVEATCTSIGYDEYSCRDCGKTYYKNIKEMTDHTIVTDEAVAPTYTTPGKTEGKHCAVCGKVFAEQIELPMDAVPSTHIHSYTSLVTEPACTSKGYTTYTCICGDSYKDDYVDATGHNKQYKNVDFENVDPVTLKATTCNKSKTCKYKKELYCTKCNDIFSVETVNVSLESHKFGAYVSDKNATTTKDGTKSRICSVCGVKETVTDTGSKLSSAEDKIAKEYGVDPETAKEIQATATKYGVSSDTLAITNTAVTKRKNDADFKGSQFNLLRAQSTKVTKNTVSIKWTKVKGADGYIVYASPCGKNNVLKKVKTVSNKVTTYKYTKYKGKKLKKGTYYKFFVVAYKNVRGVKVTMAASKTIHEVTAGGKMTSSKAVQITKLGSSKKVTSKITLKKGKSAAIKAKEVKTNAKLKLPKHRGMAYESTNKKIATVSSKGVITAKKKGTCTIYVYAQNGKYKTIKVTVK